MSPDALALRGPAPRRLLILLATLALSGCTKNLDMPRIKASIKEGIQKQAGVAVLWVECPQSRKARAGDRFECRAGVEGGAVTIDVVQDEYANAQWTQREQLLELSKVEATIRDGLKQNLGLETSVRCPGPRIPSVAGTRFACTVTRSSGAGAPFEAMILIKDTQGQIDWSVPKSALPSATPKHPASR